MLIDMRYSQDSASPMERELCVRVNGLQFCILENIPSGRGEVMTWHLTASGGIT